MKIFDNDSDEKVNFVDKNNVLVGYDMEACCCETANWFISQTEENDIPEPGNGLVTELDDYVFDTTYFEKVEPKMEGSKSFKQSVLDEGDMVRFKLVAPKKGDLFLHLFNAHNGYYGHGFEAKIGGRDWQAGTL